jgi:hypothetical protein
MAKSGKGSSFEREICKKLSLWFTNGANDCVFWRSSNSGGRATVREKVGKKTQGQYGDIACIDPIGLPLLQHTNIELKRGYNQASPMSIIDAPATAKRQLFEEFIRQSHKDSIRSGAKTWWLIHKRDRRETMIYFPSEIYPKYRIPSAVFLLDRYVVICEPLEPFLSHNSPNNVIKGIYS